jgi:adenosylcobyric acid synthase
MAAKTIMVMGTSSSAGKSLLTTALCRCFSRRGLRVAPFKAQNMSNNAAVCCDGTEIGRSQALQAIAAGALPHSDMNPILLKPEGQTRSQVIVNGRPHQTLEAVDYYQRRQQLWPHVTAALDRLREQYDVVVIEGAGSPAELNLASVEMVNMSVARYCQSPVLLVGDIERGGVFAQLLGTLWLLEPEDRKLIKALLVNKFRGDLSLFESGVEILQERGGVEVLGVLPWIEGLKLPEEDAVALSEPIHQDSSNGDPTNKDSPRASRIDIAVIHLPHIANFDDFDPLAVEPSVNLRYVRSCDQLGQPNVIILPGTKNTIGDLQWLRETGLADRIEQSAASETTIVGICGGYQMLGQFIDNPHRLESGVERAAGLGLLKVSTTFEAEKQTCQVQLQIADEGIVPGMIGEWLSGYEIHNGQTNSNTAWLKGSSAPDGAHASGGRVWGCYLHGLFHNDQFRTVWLKKLGGQSSLFEPMSSQARLQQSLDKLADAFEAHIDFDRLMEIVFESTLNQETQHVG